jgi:hypothetical protein
MSASNRTPAETTPLPKDLERLAIFLDSQFRLPLGIRVGWDGLIGLVPFVGGLLTTAVSGYIVLRSALAGASPAVVARMVLNILIDNGIGALPFFGWIGDFAWKSNLKNIELYRRDQLDPAKTARRSFWVIVSVVVSLVLIAAIFTAIAVYLAWAILGWLRSL